MESRRVVIKQPRTRSALFFASLAVVAVWGGFGVTSTGFDRAFRLVALVACGLSGLFFLYFLVRPPTVLVISHRGIRFPYGIRSAGGREISWTDMDCIRIFLLPGPFVDKPWMWLLSPFPWVIRRSFRFLGVVPVEGSELDVRHVPTSASDCWNGSECVAGSATNATGKGREHDQGVRSYSSN
jgi:hypothetical protein